jgi:uncharacterized delta-60 repeat protein
VIRLVVAALALGGCHYVFELEDRSDAGTDAKPDGPEGPAGALDKSFAGRGWYTVGVAPSYGHAVAVAASSAVTAAGYVDMSGTNHCLAVQLDAIGAPTSFGIQTFPFSGCVANAVAIDDSAKVVLAGTSNEVDLLVARRLAQGPPDVTFAGGGVYTFDGGLREFGEDLALVGDKILVVGGGRQEGMSSETVLTLQLDANGVLDPGWNGVGVSRPVNEVQTSALGVAVGPNIAIAGTSEFRAVVVRMTPDGLADGSFGSGGIQSVGAGAMPFYAYGIAQRPDGRVIAGVQQVLGPVEIRSSVVALDASGMLDPEFNNGNPLVIDFGTTAKLAQIALQPDGKLVVAATIGLAGDSEIGLARVTVDGQLDPTFGEAGIVRSRPQPDASYDVNELVFGGNRIVIAGTEMRFGVPHLYIARYLP